MKYLPEWLPGCKFQKVAREGRQLASDVLHKPYAEAKDKIVMTLIFKPFSMITS